MRYCHPDTPDPSCILCGKYELDDPPGYRLEHDGIAARLLSPSRASRRKCRYLGDKLPGQPCGSTLHKCLYDDSICSTLTDCKEAKRTCKTCPHHLADDGLPVPKNGIRFDHTTLAVGTPGRRFNPSLVAWGDGYAMAWRSGWRGSEIYVSLLDWAFREVGQPIQLRLTHHAAGFGREDPRLFWLAGKLHVMYIGVIGQNGPTNVLYARLDDHFRVQAIFHPAIPGRNPWEKNHQYFEHEGQLHAVYTFNPHRILRINGDAAEWAYETPTNAPWNPHTEIRGGAAPVRVGEEWWSFFHASRNQHYHMGLYTFDAEPPFRVRRIIPDALLWADRVTNRGSALHPSNYCPVLFPAGAVHRGSDWIISAAEHDRWITLLRFSHVDLEKRLVECGQPKWWSSRNTVHDEGIWWHVSEKDEYGLDGMDLKDASVLDIGAHIGCFAHAAHKRGAGLIHCYEPCPEFMPMLASNTSHMPGVTPSSFAIGEGTALGLGRWPTPEQVDHTSGWSVIADVRGTIPVIGLDEAIVRLASVSPTGRVELLKIDCEGAEWPAFSGATRLDLVDRIVGEWHDYVWSGRKWGTGDLAGLLPGFVVVTQPPAEGTSWGLFSASRPVVPSPA